MSPVKLGRKWKCRGEINKYKNNKKLDKHNL